MLELKEGISIRKQVVDFTKPAKMLQPNKYATHVLLFGEPLEDPTYVFVHEEDVPHIVPVLQNHEAIDFVNVIRLGTEGWLSDEEYERLTGVQRSK